MIDAGLGAADKKLVRILVERCSATFHELEENGVEFKKKSDGSFLSVVPCFGKLLRGDPASVVSYRDALWKMLMESGASIRTGISVISLVTVDGRCCGAIVRSEERCREGLEIIFRIEREFNPWRQFLENNNIRNVTSLYSHINLSKILLEVMKYRKESRGAHFRMDYPEIDSSFKGFITEKKEHGLPSITLNKNEK